MLYVIGLGLGDAEDITLYGYNTLKSCEKIFADFYTSIFASGTIKELENQIRKKIIILKRKEIEEENILIEEAKNKDIAFLVIGDPLAATTHSELILRASENNVKYKIIHNASIFTAIANTGLQLYKFGKTTTIVKPKNNWFPLSPYEIIKQNLSINAHTLCLLDLDLENNDFLLANDAIKLLLKMESIKQEKIINKNKKIIVCTRLGGKNKEDNKIYYGKITHLMNLNFGKPPHCIIIPSKMHFMEEEVLKTIAINITQY